MNRSEALQLKGLIEKAKTILLTTHINPDGDGLGTGSALMHSLKKMGKKVDFINRDTLPAIYSFLPGSRQIRSMQKVKGRYDLVIFLECPDLQRNGHVFDHASQAKCSVNIDHHLGNIMYADMNIVDPAAPAVGVQIYRFMKWAGWEITKEAAQGLYTAIVTDTGSFGYSNTTPETHEIASELIKAGVKPSEIGAEVYATSEGAVRLTTMMLNGLKLDKGIGYSVLTRAMFKKSKARENETDNFINVIRAMKEVKVAVLFKEIKKNVFKISFRSKKGVDVNLIASELNGGGHKYAAGCVVSLPMKQALKKVLHEIKRSMAARRAK